MNFLEKIKPYNDIAKQLSASNIIPAQYRDKPDIIAAMIVQGDKWGLTPFESISNIDFINGKLRLSSAKMWECAVNQDGVSDYGCEYNKEKKIAIAYIVKNNKKYEDEFSYERAVKSNLTKNPIWQNYTKQMVEKQAKVLVARSCMSSLGGTYFEGELPTDNIVTNSIEIDSTKEDALAQRKELYINNLDGILFKDTANGDQSITRGDFKTRIEKAKSLDELKSIGAEIKVKKAE